MTDICIKPTSGHFQDLTGQRFGRWTVLAFAGIAKKLTSWTCLCECGTRKQVFAGALKRGTSKSCGCLSREMASKRFYRHGASSGGRKTCEFTAWIKMIDRTTNQNYSGYRHWGGRGIRVCSRWLESFEHFYADMGERPSPQHSLDRWPDNNGNYEPGNCRWATTKEQGRNRSNNRRLCFQGETMTLVEWSDRTGIKSGTIRARIQNGWPVEEALKWRAKGQ